MAITRVLFSGTTAILLSIGIAQAASAIVPDAVIIEQNKKLVESSVLAGSGPQSPRDLSTLEGKNLVQFGEAPPVEKMHLCNIHFHANAEHKGGEFTKYAGNGDGTGFGTGYKYSGELTTAELAPYAKKVGESEHGHLAPGDTIEMHYVHTTAQVKPGATLGACLSEAIKNPQLRVETQVYVIVNDDKALDLVNLTTYDKVNGYYQALKIPKDTGTPIKYDGSTTGPAYNEKSSPMEVSWSVRPKIAKVSISTVETWLKDNIFKESHAHGVRNLVTAPELISDIEK